MVDLIPFISTIILNVNGLIKKQRLSEWIKKQDSTVYVEMHYKYIGTNRLKFKR